MRSSDTYLFVCWCVCEEMYTMSARAPVLNSNSGKIIWIWLVHIYYMCKGGQKMIAKNSQIEFRRNFALKKFTNSSFPLKFIIVFLWLPHCPCPINIPRLVDFWCGNHVAFSEMIGKKFNSKNKSSKIDSKPRVVRNGVLGTNVPCFLILLSHSTVHTLKRMWIFYWQYINITYNIYFNEKLKTFLISWNFHFFTRKRCFIRCFISRSSKNGFMTKNNWLVN